jgi:hypothetical protein
MLPKKEDKTDNARGDNINGSGCGTVDRPETIHTTKSGPKLNQQTAHNHSPTTDKAAWRVHDGLLF